jgi:alkylated DNA repair dioxygenase AlkB
MQSEIFETHETISLPGGGQLALYRAWLDGVKASRAMQHFLSATPWEQPNIQLAGRTLPIPRLQAWYGEMHAQFTYSGTQFQPLPFTAALIKLKGMVSSLAGVEFNSVLINQYRDENDSVGWHADDEPEFGRAPIIASLSLGAERRFCLKPKKHHLDNAGWKKRQRSIVTVLRTGDLLIMDRNVQKLWQHCIPKESSTCEPRINLTFRKVYC